MQKKSRELAYNLAFDVCAFCFEWEVYNNTYCYFHGLWACDRVFTGKSVHL